ALSEPADTSEPWQTKLDRFICSQAILLALAGVPGIYLHSLFGSHGDREAFVRSRWKRDLNHAHFELGDLEALLADPSSEASQTFNRYAQLLVARRAEPAFHPNASQQVLAAAQQVFGVRRESQDGTAVIALHNVSATLQRVDLAVVDAA